MLPQQKQQLVDLFTRSLAALGVRDVAVVLERPKVEAHGDIACNVALQVAKRLGRNPREIAQQLAADLQAQPGARDLIDAVEIAGSGIHQPAHHGGGQAGDRAQRAARARVLRHRPCARRRARDGRVRVGQPDRPAASRPRAAGGARRRARQRAGGAGLAGHARVLLQRRRRADRQPRALGTGAGEGTASGRRRVSGRRLSRRVHRRHRARFPRQGDGDRARRHAGAGKRRHRRPGHDPPLRRRLPAPRTGHGPRSARRALRQLLPRVLAVRRRQGRCHGRRRSSTRA